MVMFKIILGWVQQHIAAAIVVSVVVISGAVATPVILLNVKDEPKPNKDIKEEVKQDDQEAEAIEQEPELNEDGCPVGFFLNYYGICQDEHLYEPQECPDGYIWNSDNVAAYTIDNGDGTASVDYKAAYGIDGLPKGTCQMDFDTQDAWYRSHGYPGMNPKDRELYNHINDCERGSFYSSETKTCVDMTASDRSWYEKQVLSKHDPKDDLPKCSERSETDQACLKD